MISNFESVIGYDLTASNVNWTAFDDRFDEFLPASEQRLNLRYAAGAV